MVAARTNSIELCRLVVGAGADMNRTTVNGRTAESLATDAAVIQYLQSVQRRQMLQTKSSNPSVGDILVISHAAAIAASHQYEQVTD